MNTISKKLSAVLLALGVGTALPAAANTNVDNVEADEPSSFAWGITPVVAGSINIDGDVTPAAGLGVYGEFFYGRHIPVLNKLVKDVSVSASVIQTINIDDHLTNNFTAFSHRVQVTDRIEAAYTHGKAKFGAGIKGKFDEAMAKVCVFGKCNDDINGYAVVYNHHSSYQQDGMDMITTAPQGFMWGIGVKYDKVSFELLQGSYNKIEQNAQTGQFEVEKTRGTLAGLGTTMLSIRVPIG